MHSSLKVLPKHFNQVEVLTLIRSFQHLESFLFHSISTFIFLFLLFQSLNRVNTLLNAPDPKNFWFYWGAHTYWWSINQVHFYQQHLDDTFPLNSFGSSKGVLIFMLNLNSNMTQCNISILIVHNNPFIHPFSIPTLSNSGWQGGWSLSHCHWTRGYTLDGLPDHHRCS